MADRIKGISVEIGGNTQGLDKALKGVNKSSKKLQSELRDVQRLLKFDPNNAELLAQKQKLLNDQIENSSEKLKQLKNAEQQVQQQFERGDIGQEQYRAFQRELQDTESYIRNTKNALQDLQDEQQNSAKRTKELETLFQVTGKELEDFADIIGTRTVRAIQQGTASTKDLDRAFDLVAKSSLGATTDIDKVKIALEQLQNGEKSIKGVRKELQKLAQDSDDAKGSVKDLGGELTNLVAGAGAGLGIGAVIGKALDMSDVDTTIDISMDVPEESKQAVKDAIKDVGVYIDDVEGAMDGVRKQFQLNASLTDEQNTQIVKSAGTIAKAYKQIDFTELIQETHEMALGMEMTHDEALGMTKSLLDIGFPPEQLDIINEYGQNLVRAGYSAEEVQAIMESGVETGTWNIDNLLDGLKEGRIKLAEFGAEVPKAIADSLKGTDISKKQLQEWGKAIANGGEQGKKAYQDVAQALSQVEDETKRNELGVAFYGTMWEEQGENITNTILGASEMTKDLGEGTRQLAEDTARIEQDPTIALKNALNDLWNVLKPLLTTVAEFVTKIAEWMKENPQLTATILAIVSAIGILVGIFMVVMPIVVTLTSLAGALGVGIGALATPILIAIGVIASLIAIGVLLYKNWDEIIAWGKKLWKSVSEYFSKLWASVSEYMTNLWKDVKKIWGKVVDFFEGIDLVQIGEDIMQGLIDGLWNMASKVWQSAKDIASGIGEKVANILKLGSPSKLLMSMGEDTGEGMAIGLKNSLGKIKNMASEMGKMAIPEVDMNIKNGTQTQASGKQLTVNLHSPRALDVRDANREFNRTLNKMSLMW